MKQLDLVKIPAQTLRERVQEKLHGFALRQQARAQKRRADRSREKKPEAKQEVLFQMTTKNESPIACARRLIDANPPGAAGHVPILHEILSGYLECVEVLQKSLVQLNEHDSEYDHQTPHELLCKIGAALAKARGEK